MLDYRYYINAYTIWLLILLIVLVVVLYLILTRQKKDLNIELFLEKHRCSNGIIYGIQEIFNDPLDATELLCRLHGDMKDFVKKVSNKYCGDTFKNCDDNNKMIEYPNILKSGLDYKNICESVRRLERNLNRVDVEEAPNEDNSSSYTIDKNKLLAICLREKPNNTQFHDYNTLWFVVAHEMAHMMSISEGHNDEFIRNFKFILLEAVEFGFYKSVNYSVNPVTYCGVKVTNNPIYKL